MLFFPLLKMLIIFNRRNFVFKKKTAGVQILSTIVMARQTSLTAQVFWNKLS